MKQNVDEVIKDLTEDLKNELKDIIKECKEREANLNNIKKDFSTNKDRLIKAFSNLQLALESIETESKDLKDKVDELYLRSIPNDKFFKA